MTPDDADYLMACLRINDSLADHYEGEWGSVAQEKLDVLNKRYSGKLTTGVLRNRLVVKEALCDQADAHGWRASRMSC